MNKNDLVITLDFGTQSLRAIVFNQNGETLAAEQYHYAPAYFSLKPGYAEQDVNFYLDKPMIFREILKEIIVEKPERFCLNY